MLPERARLTGVAGESAQRPRGSLESLGSPPMTVMTEETGDPRRRRSPMLGTSVGVPPQGVLQAGDWGATAGGSAGQAGDGLAASVGVCVKAGDAGDWGATNGVQAGDWASKQVTGGSAGSAGVISKGGTGLGVLGLRPEKVLWLLVPAD